MVVRQGTADPEFGIDLSGWQGKVLDIQTSDDGVATVHIEWDSIALKNMPGSVIEQFMLFPRALPNPAIALFPNRLALTVNEHVVP